MMDGISFTTSLLDSTYHDSPTDPNDGQFLTTSLVGFSAADLIKSSNNP